MIFLTVGSELPFTRLVKAVDQWCKVNQDQKVFGQIGRPGSAGYRPFHFEWEEFVSRSEYHQKYKDAELIVGHAGTGSIITALVMSKPILIMPRCTKFHESRNDHQIATANKFLQRKGVFVADDENDVGPMLDKLINMRETAIKIESAGPYAEERLIETIRSFIHTCDNNEG